MRECTNCSKDLTQVDPGGIVVVDGDDFCDESCVDEYYEVLEDDFDDDDEPGLEL